MGSYDIYDYAFDDRFDTPSCRTQLWNRVKWRARPYLRKLREWTPRFYEYLEGIEERRAPKRYDRWRRGQNKLWRDRLPREIEKPAISLNTKTSDQFQSRFFQMPLEVREAIYDYIFDGGTVLLDVQEKVDGKVVLPKKPYRLRNLKPQQCLAILQACKRTYVEAAHLLYSTNAFIFCDLTTFVCFKRIVPNYHWHLIQRIRVAWNYEEIEFDFEYDHRPCPMNEETWKAVCRDISTMNGLKRLRVDLVSTPIDPYHDQDYLLSQPLKDITAPARFEFLIYGKRKVLAGRCGCGCGRAEGFHGSRP